MNQPGKFWVVELALDNRRVMAEVFEHPEGIVFADIGWDASDISGHPFHVVKGRLERDGAGYEVGDARIEEITEDDPLTWSWLDWLTYRKTAAGQRASREACLEAITQSGIL